MKKVLIDDWRRAWRFFSLWFIAAAVMLQSMWDALPADFKTSLPVHTQRDVTIGLLVLGGFSRLIKQTKTINAAVEKGE